jgi:hypothetical protein
MSRPFVLPPRVVGVLGILGMLGVGALPGLERAALANGRLPGTSSITFRQGHERDVIAGLTFGLAISHDGGATWAWMCDDALGIGSSPYDPIYAYTPAGSLFATTLQGLVVMRDGCTFPPAPSAKTFVSTSALGPDGAFYYGAAQTADATHSVASDFQIYKSIDDGVTFPVHPQPDDPQDTNVWWQSIMAAPSNPQIVYLSGFRYVPAPSGGGTVREHLVFRSDNGGTSWAPSGPPTLSGLTLAQNSLIHIVGIASDDPKHVYVRVEYIDNNLTDGLYLSSDSGATWSQIHTQPDRFLAFVVRAANNAMGKRDLLATTAKNGTEISHDDGMNWAPLANAPHINCLTENSAGELWACTQNYGVGQTQSDDAGIMKTTDLSAWTKVLRYQDLVGPVTGCGADTIQQKTCNQAALWCGVCSQLACTPSPSYVCGVPGDDPVPPPPMPKAGCCDTGSGAGGPLALALSVATFLWRPRRRVRRPHGGSAPAPPAKPVGSPPPAPRFARRPR